MLSSLLSGDTNFTATVTYVIASLIVIFVTMPFREFAHAFVATKLGDRTARYQGRLTLNPLSHIDYFGALCIILFGFGWARPVPVNPSAFKNPKRDMALTALAGPAMNLILAFIGVFFHFALAGSTATILKILCEMFDLFSRLNIIFAVFHLIPIPPLDGWKILGALLPARIYWKIMAYERYISFAVILLICTGALSVPLGIISNFFYNIVSFLPRIIFSY